jgi:hypothetical protein
MPECKCRPNQWTKLVDGSIDALTECPIHDKGEAMQNTDESTEKYNTACEALDKIRSILDDMGIHYAEETYEDGGENEEEPYVVIYVPPAADKDDRVMAIVHRDGDFKGFRETACTSFTADKIYLFSVPNKRGWENKFLDRLKDELGNYYPQLDIHREFRHGSKLISDLRSLQNSNKKDPLGKLLGRTIKLLKALGIKE